MANALLPFESIRDLLRLMDWSMAQHEMRAGTKRTPLATVEYRGIYK